MKVINKGKLINNVDIQLEDWKEDYDFMDYSSTIACYPISKQTLKGAFSPNINERFRLQLDFESSKNAIVAFNQLINGSKKIIDFSENIRNKEYIKCI